MAGYLTRNLNQTAVYWGNPVEVGDGSLIFDDGVEVDCRWEERQELYMDNEGNERKSQAIVHVKQDMKVGEYLYLGVDDDLDSDISNPTAVDSFEIKSFEKIPNIKGDKFIRRVFLSKDRTS